MIGDESEISVIRAMAKSCEECLPQLGHKHLQDVCCQRVPKDYWGCCRSGRRKGTDFVYPTSYHGELAMEPLVANRACSASSMTGSVRCKGSAFPRVTTYSVGGKIVRCHGCVVCLPVLFLTLCNWRRMSLTPWLLSSVVAKIF